MRLTKLLLCGVGVVDGWAHQPHLGPVGLIGPWGGAGVRLHTCGALTNQCTQASGSSLHHTQRSRTRGSDCYHSTNSAINWFNQQPPPCVPVL